MLAVSCLVSLNKYYNIWMYYEMEMHTVWHVITKMMLWNINACNERQLAVKHKKIENIQTSDGLIKTYLGASFISQAPLWAAALSYMVCQMRVNFLFLQDFAACLCHSPKRLGPLCSHNPRSLRFTNEAAYKSKQVWLCNFVCCWFLIMVTLLSMKGCANSGLSFYSTVITSRLVVCFCNFLLA